MIYPIQSVLWLARGHVFGAIGCSGLYTLGALFRLPSHLSFIHFHMWRIRCFFVTMLGFELVCLKAL